MLGPADIMMRMNRPLYRVAAWTLCFLACASAGWPSPDAAADRRAWLRSALERSLESNRSVLVRLKRERRRLAASTDAEGRRRLQEHDVKIASIERDRSDLWTFLSEEEQAAEFLKDLVAEAPERPSGGPPSVSTDDLYLMHEMALERVSQERYPEALRIYEEIILHDPGDDEAYLLIGHIYMLLSRYGQAESAFLNAVDIDPSNLEEIAPFYENLVLRSPNDGEAYTHLGFAYLILGRFDRALTAFENALAIDPGSMTAAEGLRLTREQLR